MAEQDGAREWRVVQGFPDYEVSDDGIVRRLRETRAGAPGRPHPRGYTLRPYPRARTGHLWVSLRAPGGTSRGVWVHRLVLETFVGQRPSPAHQVAHGNGRPADNRVRNLRWATAVENAADREMHGMTARGEKSGVAKLTEATVRDIRRRRREGETGLALSREYGVSPSLIAAVKNRRIWRHVADPM